MATAPIELRPHQREAVSATTRILGEHPRASVIAACGTGKTLIAARTTARIARRGRALVLLPTLDLLSQTIRSWHMAGRKGTTVAVCSARQALDHEPLGADIPLTTDPAELTTLIAAPRPGPITAYATYASLPAVIAAHRDHHLPPWDLVVVDEAHRTAGRLGKAWAAVHHDDQIPAARRLYLTATPRIWDPAENPDDDTDAVASMDDETLFGPVAYRLTLSDAIDLGLLADYQILVPVVTDEDLRDWLATGPGAGVDGLRLAGRQVAALRAIHDHQLRRILTFHHRVADARAFATTLADTAATLSADLRPQGLWADWVSGSHSPQVRRRLLLEFAAHTGPHAPSVLSNARVLGEGIDVPAIDAVVFAEPKNSPVDTVQAVGRALRQQPGARKKATLVVPVYLTPGEDPDDLLGADAYTPLWHTIQALRAHDDRLEARLADPRTHRPTMPPHDPDAWLHFDRPTQAEEVALALSLRVLAPKSAEWRRGLTAARRYHRTHHHLDVPQNYEDSTGYALGRWLTWQRHLHTAGSLDAARTQALERLGIIWDPRQQAFDRGLAHATAYAAHHGHLAVPIDHVHDDFPLGRWLATQRTRADHLSDERTAALTSLDQWWNPPWPITWQRAYHAARQQAERETTASSVQEWLTAQQARADVLHPEQCRLLKGLGLDLPDAPVPYSEDSQLSARERAFQRGLAAARAFREREGHLNVPQRHIEEIEGDHVRLGQWLSNLRRRRSSLSPQRQAALAELGV
ncbi:Helicase associated domain protein (plasmid) [Streptomyces sp. BB1-1-1]|uniref:DEAD/DEAH box helicase n=1 Tax=Streptomyces sp. BB1-1-1 TaxID=3074430 RepID=UPI002877CBCD|nr:Helicase associated domain protein [Streptomyces sp. BB1-1-1]WND32811.1 Helicase associated domain protein [Streptomyces sp. BB1-1-1]WND40121.1 Helicase associated domain protein [Streptomyces sp. BB1-1-1]WND40953.1 Helicase associated domain protein [Streptomyces sp. BB1-1-1]